MLIKIEKNMYIILIYIQKYFLIYFFRLLFYVDYNIIYFLIVNIGS
jgi:hypothetical protein